MKQRLQLLCSLVRVLLWFGLFLSLDKGVVTILESWNLDVGSEVIDKIWLQTFSQFRDWMMMRRYVTSMVALLQLNFGSKRASKGYPKIKSSIPKLVTRNLICLVHPLVWTWRSTKSEIIPALLDVPLMFQIFLSCCSCWVPSPSHLISPLRINEAISGSRVHKDLFVSPCVCSSKWNRDSHTSIVC